MRAAIAAIAVVVAIVASARAVRADDKPWAKGVSEENQRKALELYRDGNTDFVEDRFTEALAKYQQAIAYWDHPAIRFNAAICLDNLDRPLEAFEYMTAAMKWPDAIGKDHVQRGQKLLDRLAGKTNELEIAIAPRDAELRLDGKALALDGGVARQRVVVGEHQIVAVKPRYRTETRSISVAPGATTKIVIEMKLETQRRLVRRWAKWKPWAVFAGGVAVAAIGEAFELRAQQNFDRYAQLGMLDGCPRPGCDAAFVGTQADGRRDKVIGGVALSVGGAIAATGIALVIFNQPRLVAPELGRDRVTLAISGRW